MQRPCPCPLHPIGSGIGGLVTLLHIWSKRVQEMLVSESRCSSFGEPLVLAVLFSLISSSLKPRDCLLSRLMNCTMTASNPGISTWVPESHHWVEERRKSSVGNIEGGLGGNRQPSQSLDTNVEHNGEFEKAGFNGENNALNKDNQNGDDVV